MTQPPASPQQSPYRCETCEHHMKAGCSHNHYCMKKEYDSQASIRLGTRMLNATVEHISEFGCCSHSANTDARERVEKVIKELEARLDQSKSQQACFTSEEGARADGYESGLESAIALLKDGVERK